MNSPTRRETFVLACVVCHKVKVLANRDKIVVVEQR